MNEERNLEFLLADAAGPWLQTLPAMQGRSGGTTDATLLDTFDRRLFHGGKVCAVERSGKGSGRLVLRSIGTRHAGPHAVWPSPAPPRFAWDVADPRLRSELEALIEVRALLPQCRLRRVCQPVSGLPVTVPDAVRICRVRYAWLPDRGRPRPLGERLAVSWRAPDDKAAGHFIDTLLEHALVTPPTDDIWREALAAAGKLPPAERTGSGPDLVPELRADVAVRRILTALFEVMTTNEAGLLDNIDAEFLHDFRVAVRRSRAVLGQLKNVFPERSIARNAQELAWLGAITGPARDLDVYLLHFQDLQALLPVSRREDLRPLQSLLSRESAAAHAALVRHLTSARYQRFKTQWAAFLARPAPRSPTAPNALEPIGALAGRRIWTLYRRVTKAAAVVDEETPPEQIHALRKTCKKLRYLLEYVQPFQAPERTRRPIKDLKLLQDHLGAFQDAEVQMDYLGAWFAELRADALVSSPTLLALGMLFGRFEQIQAARRAEIPKALRRFARKGERRHFKTLFKGPLAAVAGNTGVVHPDRVPLTTEGEPS